MHLCESHPTIEKGTEVNHTTRTTKTPSLRTGSFVTLRVFLRAQSSQRRLLTPLLALATLAVLALPAAAQAAEPCPNEALREAQHSAFLPDCRAYELVSPPTKGGGDVTVFSARTRAAADGGAATFVSLRGFGDVRDIGVSTEYESVRSTESNPGSSGWVTHAITPVQRSLTFAATSAALDPLYEGEFSPELSTAIFRSWSPLTDAPMVAGVPNLYVRRGLGSGLETSELATDCPACSSPLPAPTFSQFSLPPALPFDAGTSQDFTHVLFESTQDLTADASGTDQKLYEFDHGTVRLAGILPDGSAASSSVAGWGASGFYYTPHVISSDGSRVFFIAPPGSCAFNHPCGPLYMRTDHAVTVQLNASERTDCADHNPSCSGTLEPDPNGAQAATYWDASVDGSRVFFESQEALTDDAPLSPSLPKLYMYDASKGDADPHNLTFLSADNEPADGINSLFGVIGASDDGHYVYFVAGGQLVAGGALPNEPAVFVWHDGVVRYVGAFPNSGDLFEATNSIWTLFQKTARVTPDGRHLLYSSTASNGPTGADQGTCAGNALGPGCRELYLYSYESGQLQCVSCKAGGTTPTANTLESVYLDQGAALQTRHLGRSLSDDARRVFFSTAEALAPGDTNGKSDAYEWEANGAGDCNQPSGCLALISSGKDSADSYFMDASSSGDDVFFTTRARLVGWDVDNNTDLYDARVHGGFPNPPAAHDCNGEGCRAPASGAPSFDTPSSLSVTALGNPTTPDVKKVVVKHLTKAQKLARSLKKCKAKRKRSQRKKCESSARKSFGRGK
jgi:hypothetical protein